MNQKHIHKEVYVRLTTDDRIISSLQSIIWFGSVKNNQDVHERSDCDLQVILDKPDHETILHINQILEDYPELDLSIMYMQDIYDRRGNVIFHDGTKGLFFIYVLAAGEVMYGRNVYGEITDKFTLNDLKPSLLITAREYLSRLRVMAIQEINDTLRFKKYSLKLFKDILIYYDEAPFLKMANITNNRVRKEILALHDFSPQSRNALEAIADYSKNFNREEMAYLLYDYEQIIERMCNE